MKQPIVDRTLNGSGVRDIVRVLGVSAATIIDVRKKKPPAFQQVNTRLLQRQVAEQVDTLERRRARRLNVWARAGALALVVLLAGSALADAPARHARVAVLTRGLPFQPVVEGLREGLVQLGYREGHNLTFLIEDEQGNVASQASLAAKLVATKPDVLFTIGTTATATAKQATTTLPIVFTFVGDPLRTGLIASYASSQNNLTGVATSAGPLTGKRLEILQEIAPGIKRVLVLMPPQESMSIATVAFQALAAVAPKLGIELVRQEVTSPAEVAQQLQAVPLGSVDAIYYVPSDLVGTQIDLLIAKAKEARLPLSVTDTTMVERGALVSYGADMRLLGVQAAQLVAKKILKGAQPTAMPIQTPDKVLLAINLHTAKTLGLVVPQSILERADRVVE